MKVKKIIMGVKVKGLIDTGSMVSTIAEEFLCILNDSPVIHSIDELGLRVNTANGHSMSYSGVVEVDIIVPCFGNKSFTVLMLVVPTTEYNKEVTVIIGTNIIHGIKESLSNAEKVPLEWETAFDAIQSDSVGVVKTT